MVLLLSKNIKHKNTSVTLSLLQYIKLLFCSKAEREFFFKMKHLLGFAPKNMFFYKKAFTHKSAKSIFNGAKLCNERLEFLGDTVLDSIIADYVFHLYPNKSEGFLTKMKSRIVSRKTLNDIAVTMHLDAFITCNIPNVQTNDAMGNAFEALVGAIYLDKGYAFTKKYIATSILAKMFDFNYLESVDCNYKSKLIEIVQKNKNTIKFKTLEVDNGNCCSQLFSSTVFINQQLVSVGEGSTKKEAEQQASQKAISQMYSVL